MSKYKTMVSDKFPYIFKKILKSLLHWWNESDFRMANEEIWFLHGQKMKTAVMIKVLLQAQIRVPAMLGDLFSKLQNKCVKKCL